MSIPLEALDKPVAYHRVFRKISGSTVAAVFLSQAWYWTLRVESDREGWFYKTQAEWESETGLSRREQETARKALREIGVLEEDRRGVPAQLWFCLDRERLEELIREEVGACTFKNGATVQTGMAEPANQECSNPPFLHTEITTETTPENTSSPRASRRGKQTPFPDGFTVTESMYRWALDAKGMPAATVDLETEQFENHHRARDTRFVDWERAWRTWIGNAAKWQRERARTGTQGSRVEDPERRNWTAEQWFED